MLHVQGWGSRSRVQSLTTVGRWGWSVGAVGLVGLERGSERPAPESLGAVPKLKEIIAV